MYADDSRLRTFRRMAWLTLLLLLAVTCLSAYLRHRAAGLGCEPWPSCFGQGERVAAGAVVVGGQALTVARAAHRVTATLALLLVIAMVVVSLARRPRLRRDGALSLALLALALMLALLGVITPGSRLPAVAIGNLLGGLVTFAIAARLVSPPMPLDRVLAPVAIGVTLLLSAQIISGGLISAANAGLACTDIRQCIEQASAGGWDWAALNPWREPAFAVGTPHVEGALAQLLHRLASLAVAPALACLGVLAVQRGRRRGGLAVLLLVVCVVALGLVSGSTGLPLVPVLLHNLATALLFAAVVRLA
jgi:heme a synthase